jgi:Ca2+-binding EF-hand superfamily protein
MDTVTGRRENLCGGKATVWTAKTGGSWAHSHLRLHCCSYRQKLRCYCAAVAFTTPSHPPCSQVPYIREAFRMMQDAFYSIDTDQGGSIDIGELQGMWHQMGVELDQEVLTAMFAEADVDQSGKITLAEFLSSTCMWVSANEAAEAFAGISALRNSFDWVSQAFRLFDPTESGSVKKEDLSAVLAQVGLETLPNELHQTFAFLGDFEERSEVTFKEFLIGLFLCLTKDS